MVNYVEDSVLLDRFKSGDNNSFHSLLSLIPNSPSSPAADDLALVNDVDVGSEAKPRNDLRMFLEEVEVLLGGKFQLVNRLVGIVAGIVVDPEIPREVEGLSVYHAILGRDPATLLSDTRIGDVASSAEIGQATGALEGRT